ncbi:MAG: long-chain fatty acid--CoA ligase [Cycloclasticus sp.]|nr:long-chain fatty acid--CoA ligase [Cycloclasticus sp.]MBG95704.1 long-chain fatty acid--CoA ligase [Cycloclasticus sp.]|tara:strand:- start:1847 stop:3469 length:1623 start_codon:yes stop_codon:yes gene_type:complete
MSTKSTMMDYPLTLTNIVERLGLYYPATEVVSRMPDKTLHRTTYSDIHKRAKRLASALSKNGIKKGDCVATLMWNHYAHLEAYLGIPVMGAVIHTLNLRLSPEDIAYIVNHAEDKVLIIDDILLPLYEQFKDQVEFKEVIVVPLSGADVISQYTNYEEYLKSGDEDFSYPVINENDAAGMCYTSGTTGRPKGVVYSHRSTVLHSLAESMADALAISQFDVVTPVVPMFHANAWGLPYTSVLVGAKQVLPGPHLDAESLLDLYEQEQVTLSAGVPTIWMAIKQAREAEPDRWKTAPNMRMAVGGAAVPESLFRAFDAFDMKIIQAWGMTETGPLATLGLVKKGLENEDEGAQYAYRIKQGVALPFVDIRIVDEQGVEQPWDGKTAGNAELRGPWVTGAYHKNEGADDKFSKDGWLKTGDVCQIDEEGYVKLTDRTKDLVKSGGEWISSVDLENAIMGHPDVLEAAVIAVAHPKWDERPLAVVVVKEGKVVTTSEIRNFLEGQFAKIWLPDAVEMIDEIPKTSTGKFMKLALREQYKDWVWD